RQSCPAVNVVVNGIGATATGVTALIVACAKFKEGAWITLILIPGLIGIMIGVRRHYNQIAAQVSSPTPANLQDLTPPLVVVPIEEWNKVTSKALRFAMTLSGDVQALHIDSEEVDGDLRRHWDEWVVGPAREASRRPPELV